MIRDWKRGIRGRGFRNYLLNWSVLALIALTAVDLYFTVQAVLFLRSMRGGAMPSMVNMSIVSVLLSIVFNIGLMYLIFQWLPKLDQFRRPLLMTMVKLLLSIIGIFLSVAFHMLALSSITMAWAVPELFQSNFLLKEVSVNFINKGIIKILVVTCIQLSYMLGKKYTGGFFFNVIGGKYRQPVTENRIIMFMDLKDSTPISEQLGHTKYFLFIRDFIHDVSQAALKYDGDIYQYVGDEIIVTWKFHDDDKSNCIKTVIAARRNLQARASYYRFRYGFVPEFRVGIHMGELSIGEIGIVKKEIAMSGEAMNITARIRSACSELNEKQIVSQDYFECTNLKEWQGKDLGVVSLKGIETRDLRLFALKI